MFRCQPAAVAQRTGIAILITLQVFGTNGIGIFANINKTAFYQRNDFFARSVIKVC